MRKITKYYLCLHIPSGLYIDNVSYIDYAQLYAQVIYELIEQHTPYWFSNDQMLRYMGCKCKHTKVGQVYQLLKTGESK